MNEPVAMGRRRVLQSIGALAVSSVGAAGLVSAQTRTWPTRPVKYICPFAAGGATDLLSRLYCQRMSTVMGQPFMVDNRTGAGGTLAMGVLAKSAPDGYTVGMVTNATHVFSKALFAKLPFDTEKDFSFFSGLWELPNVLVVNPKIPARNLNELVELCKRSPGKYTFASAGLGTSTHISAELFKMRAGVDITHVPYRGGAPANTDLMSGMVDMYFDNITGSVGNVVAGKVRALAVTGLTRSQALPDVPAIAEFYSGFELTSWTAVGGPAGVPADVSKHLADATLTVLKDQDLIGRFAALGATAYPGTGKDVANRIAQQAADMLPKLRAMGLKPE